MSHPLSLHSQTIKLLFTPVFECPASDGAIPFQFASCQDYWSFTRDDMRQRSFAVAGYWIGLVIACVLGNLLQFYGIGSASERLNKRIRDSSFLALLRQEVAFFDKRSVGSITAQLQDDAARVHAFSGEPIRTVIAALGSVAIGVIISFVVSTMPRPSRHPTLRFLCYIRPQPLSFWNSTCGRSLS